MLDFWPLNRFAFIRGSSSANPEKIHQPVFFSRILIEKIPFFFLTAVSIYLSLFLAQQDFISTAKIPLDLRIFNALAAYIDYLRRFVWPHPLAVIYPFPDAVPLWRFVCSAAALGLVSLLALRHIKKHPHLLVGWFWYLGVFVPVIGIVQAGIWSASADRFAYLPYIGIGIMVAYSLPKTKSVFRQRLLASAAVALMVACSLTANAQLSHWVDSRTILEHTVNVTDNNYIAHFHLAKQYKDKGKISDALTHLKRSISIKPRFFQAYFEMSLVYIRTKDFHHALRFAKKTVEINPFYADAHANLGAIYIYLNQPDEAIKHFIDAIRIEPEHANALNNIGFLLMKRGDYAKAIDLFKRSLVIKPGNLQTRLNLMEAEKLWASLLGNASIPK